MVLFVIAIIYLMLTLAIILIALTALVCSLKRKGNSEHATIVKKKEA